MSRRLLSFLVAFLLACADDGPTATPVPASVEITPSPVTLAALGETVQLTATVLDQSEQPMHGLALVWLTVAESVVTVSAAGLVTAISNGYATVKATVQDGGPSGNAAVTVAQQAQDIQLSRIEGAFRALGDTLRLSATARDSNGNPIPAVHPIWSSSDTSVVTVDGSGLVTAAGNGRASVRATSGAGHASAGFAVEQEVVAVQVTPAADTLRALGDTLQLSAELVDANGHPVVDSMGDLTWSSDDPNVATVDETGLVTAISSGSVEVRAELAGGTLAGAARMVVIAVDDRAVLAALYHAAGGPNWNTSRNWLTDAPLGSWHGVTTNAQGQVTRLRLQYNNLRGSIPVELGYLPKLTILELQWNELAGSIPPELGRLTNLTHVDVNTNRLEGSIPTELANLTSLTYLRLSSNYLEGSIPPELGNLTNLTGLFLHRNGNLTGSIPGELGALVNLSNLWLGGNKLTGHIPSELGRLSQLDTLYLSENQLTGEIPPELGGLDDLKLLLLSENQLTGPIPPELGKLTGLTRLILFNNELTGSIPAELGDLESLLELNFFGNQLTGSIPAELGKLATLEKLVLNLNSLTGPIPSELARLGRLRRLLLGRNELTGPIPPELGNMANLDRLFLNGNQLTGSIPPKLGNLVRLSTLSLGHNSLSGSVPAELGNLRNLTSLYLQVNELVGPLPRELANLSQLRTFRWYDTALCAPTYPAFQTWLGNIPYYHHGPDCFTDPRDALIALYNATGGEDWTNNTNWATDLPVSNWYGTTVDGEGRLTALELGNNGLSGSLPAEVAELVDLQRLELQANQLTGSIPADLGHLASLRSLDVSRNRFRNSIPAGIGDLTELRRLDLRQNQFVGRVPEELGRLIHLQELSLGNNQMTGSLPMSLVALNGLADFQWDDSGLCAPEGERFQAWLRSITHHVGGENCSSPLLVTLAATHLTQAAQNLDGDVPLIAGRPALLRVFVTAHRESGLRPDARATFFANGQEVHRVEMSMVSGLGIPEAADPGNLDRSYHATVPAAVLAPEVEMVVEIDPDSSLSRAAGSRMRLPEQGRMGLDVRRVPRMKLTVVPIVVRDKPDNTARAWASSLGRNHDAIRLLTNVLPVTEVDVAVRETYVTDVDPTSLRAWTDLLQDITLLRLTDEADGYYYGAVTRPGGAGITGLAYVSSPAAVGVPEADPMVHELGHSMSLRHAPCGLLFDPDPNYPYPSGEIGVWGYDFRSNRLVPPNTADLMGYCDPAWISDYHFAKALDHRLSAEEETTSSAANDGSTVLLLWGSVSSEGELRLDPAFVLDAAARLPTSRGPYRLEGIAANGAPEFALDFALDKTGEGGGGFVFTIPFEDEWLASLERIVLSGPEGRTELTAAGNRAMALVLDRETGQLRSVLRGEDASAAAASASIQAVGPRRVERGTRTLVSYGLPGRMPD